MLPSPPLTDSAPSPRPPTDRTKRSQKSSRWGGKLRSCEECRRRAIQCIYLSDTVECRLCISLKIQCSGPSKLSREVLRKAAKTARLKDRPHVETPQISAPSSVPARLDRECLSFALTYHLVLECVKRSIPLRFQDFGGMNEIRAELSASSGNLAHMSDRLEIACLEFMCSSAMITTHSAIVGNQVATILPTFTALSELTCLTAPSTALLRIPLYKRLTQKVLEYAENLSTSLQTIPVNDAATRISLAWSAYSEVIAFGLGSLDSFPIWRRIATQVPILKRDSRGTPESWTKMEHFVQMFRLHERDSYVVLGLPLLEPVPRRDVTLSLPPLYSFVPTDINLILLHRHPGSPTMRDRASASECMISLNKWMSALSEWGDVLSKRTVAALVYQPAMIASEACWEACSFLFSFLTEELKKVFGDPRYYEPHYPGAAQNVLRFALKMEAEAVTILFACYDRCGALPQQGAVQIKVLYRLSQYCQLMAAESIGPLLHLNSLSLVSDLVNSVSGLILQQWASLFPSDASQLREALNISAFSYPQSSRAEATLTSAISFASQQRNEREDDWRLESAKVLVESALGSIYSQDLVSYALLDIRAQYKL